MNLFVVSENKILNDDNTIYLTFDDGPHPEYTPMVLDILKQHRIKATFFCTGKNVVTYPEIAKRIVTEGHQIGNHSYSHSPYIDFNDYHKWIIEILLADSLINKLCNVENYLFRPPYGITTPHLGKALEETGHIVVGWKVRPFDTKIKNQERIAKTILKKTEPGDIILLHDTHDRIIPVLEQILPEFKKRNFNFAAIK